MLNEKLRVFSIFRSIQGESSRAGLPCSFVRLAGCPLNCIYCDTKEAKIAKGIHMSSGEIVERIRKLNTNMIEVTGGEPLAQPGVINLFKILCDEGYEVLLETSGAFDIQEIDSRVRIIMDIKTPGSGESERMLWKNLKTITSGDNELKFAVTSRKDFDWVKTVILREKLLKSCELLISPVSEMVSPSDVAEWIIESGLTLRLQLQLHKIVWPNAEVER